MKQSLKSMRKARKMSQAEVAKRVGVSQYAVSRWERNPAYLMDTAHKYVIRLSEVFEVEISQIEMGGE